MLTVYCAARTIQQSINGADDRIDQFCAEFKRLRANFDTGVSTGTALVLSQAALTIDEMSSYAHFQ